MALAAILMEQTVVMCLFLLLGYLMGKLGWVTQKGSGEITNLLVRIVVPAAIINSFFVERTPERLLQFGVSAALICAAALLSMVLSQIIFRRHPVENFGVAFSNVGFIGIPLITAVLGEKAVFYIAFYSVLVGVLQWTWGVYTITGDKLHVSPRKILTNPATIAMGLALLAFLPGWGARLPGVLTRPVSMMAAVNTPLAMVVMGCYLAGADLRSVFSDRFNWWASFVRLVLISAATAALFCLVPPAFAEARTAVFIAAITPIGVNTATLAHLFGKDSAKAVAMVCLSTILSVFTMPLMMLLAGWLWGL